MSPEGFVLTREQGPTSLALSFRLCYSLLPLHLLPITQTNYLLDRLLNLTPARVFRSTPEMAVERSPL